MKPRKITKDKEAILHQWKLSNNYFKENGLNVLVLSMRFQKEIFKVMNDNRTLMGEN